MNGVIVFVMLLGLLFQNTASENPVGSGVTHDLDEAELVAFVAFAAFGTVAGFGGF